MPDRAEAPAPVAYCPPWYIYLQSAVIAALVWYWAADFYNDDAYISLTYAQHLLDGQGLTWNPGERVEGYSNFLFVMLVAGLGWLGMDLVLASKLLGFAGYFGIVLSLYLYTRRHRPQPRSVPVSVCAALCIGLAMSSMLVLVWCFGGLESNLYAFFLSAAICLVLMLVSGRPHTPSLPAGIGLFFVLAALTHPDGALFWLFTLGFLGLVWLLDKARTHVRFSDLLIIGFVFALVFIPYTLWEYSYFGDWPANTFYAKEFGISRQYLLYLGLSYVSAAMLMPPFCIVFFGAMLYAILRSERLSIPSCFLASMFVFGLVYAAGVGGDWMPFGRFLIPLVPVFSLFTYHAGLQLIERREKIFRDLSTVLVAFSLFQLPVVYGKDYITSGVLSALVVKDYIASHWPKGSTIALNVPGTLAYMEPQYRYIDMLGLNDRHIAHRVLAPDQLGDRRIGHIKGDGAYVLSRKPDYIIFFLAWGYDSPRFLSDLEIAADPGFAADYEPVEVFIDPPEALRPSVVSWWQKKSYPGLLLNEKQQVRFMYYQRKRKD